MIPKGTFTMGTDDPQIPDDGESPPQEVTLTKDYYIDKERAISRKNTENLYLCQI